MNKSQRIYFSSGDTGNQNQDKYMTVKLEQEVETLEFMSMKLGTADTYQEFNSDYGVLVGRVIANGSVGIPNAKISVFIPITDSDVEDPDIYSVYPYKTPRDKNKEGKRYNLLPRVSKLNQETGQIEPKQAFGSFPIKEEIVGNLPFLDVYKKYYKYTALTNSAGDYMIFGLPIGTQVIHLSVDITDIGKYSMNPASMVTNLGYSPNFFTDNNSKIKSSNNLDDLPHIETQEITVDVRPFWGDTENFEIGITRQDFRIRALLVNTFTMFGSVFTDGDGASWGRDIVGGTRRISELFRARTGGDTYGIYNKRIGKVSETIYYYPSSVTDAEIDNGTADPTTEMLKLDQSEYSVYKRDGDFAFIINCNRDKIITNEVGDEVPVDNDANSGVFTKFRGFVVLEITEDEISMDWSDSIGNNTKVVPFRYKLKFPQYGGAGEFIDKPNGSTETTATIAWRKQSSTFEAQKFYSFSRFHALVTNSGGQDDDQFPLQSAGFFNNDTNNLGYNLDPNRNVGIIASNTYSSGDEEYPNSDMEFPINTDIDSTIKGFGANWINLSVYLPQVGWMAAGYSHIRNVRLVDHYHKQKEDDLGYNSYYVDQNSQEIAAGDFDTRYFPRNDVNWTDIIEVPVGDIIAMKMFNSKGFKDNQLLGTLEGQYRNGTYVPTGWGAPCPYNGGKNNAIPTSGADPRTYFYKGLGDANCIDYLYELGLIT